MAYGAHGVMQCVGAPFRPCIKYCDLNKCLSPTLTGKAPIFSYRVELIFPQRAAGEWFQSRVTSKVSLANLIYYAYPLCKSRAALTPPEGSAVALTPIYPQIFTDPALGYCQGSVTAAAALQPRPPALRSSSKGAGSHHQG